LIRLPAASRGGIGANDSGGPWCALSDIYLVYNERHDSRSGALISRAVIAKMTYLLAF
jgi:hypothetical protein